MAENHVKSSSSNQAELEFRRMKNREDMKFQLISFLLMILFSIAAFVTVGVKDFNPLFVVPLILLLAAVQVGFQFYYFMHMSQKGHGAAALFLYSGILVAVVTVIAFALIIWW